jgi:hypothetical protein
VIRKFLCHSIPLPPSRDPQIPLPLNSLAPGRDPLLGKGRRTMGNAVLCNSCDKYSCLGFVVDRFSGRFSGLMGDNGTAETVH